MNTEELTKWHNEVWWPAYNRFIRTPYPNQWGPGGKGESLKKLLTMKPSAELRSTMIKALEKQIEHRQLLGDRLKSKEAYEEYTAKLAKGGESIYKNRQSRTYIHNMGWYDEIPPIKTQTTKQGKYCSCGQPVHGPMYDKCTDCLYTPVLRIVK